MTKTIVLAIAGCLVASCGPRTERVTEVGLQDAQPGYERVTCFTAGRKIVDDYAKGRTSAARSGYLYYSSIGAGVEVNVRGDCVTFPVEQVDRKGWTPMVVGHTADAGSRP